MNLGTGCLIFCVSVILLGAIIGMARAPKAKARHNAINDAIQAMASQFGWRFDRSPTPYLSSIPKINSVLGGYGVDTFGTAINVKLVGEWRGVPITALQITNRNTDRIMVDVIQTNTMLLVPRPVPGPDVALTQQGLSWKNFLERDRQVGYPPFDSLYHVHAHDDRAARTVITQPIAELLATDPRMRERVLFFGPQHLAALFPGLVAQPRAVAATADLLVQVGQLMAGR
ncbi:hypothetical protein [Rugosimonospora africana]|nr:hypothetical protein [Rugosimonospora africana]